MKALKFMNFILYEFVAASHKFWNVLISLTVEVFSSFWEILFLNRMFSFLAVWYCFSSVQSLSHVRLFATPWITAHQASLSMTNSWVWVHSNSCPLSQWCHPTISSSVVPFSSCPQSLPASESFPVSQLFAWGGQILEFQLQHHSFQWTPRTDLL